jgi:ribonuclease G
MSAMTSDLLVNTVPGEIRLAIMEGERPSDILILRRDAGPATGDVYLSRVKLLKPELGAAFLDLGADHDGFLQLKGEDAPHEGELLICQVTREAVGNKGVRLTTTISLGALHLTLFPQGNGVKVSRRIEDTAECERLTSLMANMIAGREDDSCGYVLHTDAAGAKGEVLESEVILLHGLWDDIVKRRESVETPACLHRDSGTIDTALRALGGEARRIIVDSGEMLDAARTFFTTHMPEFASRLERHKGEPLFECYGVETELEQALERRVDLPSGGALTFDVTEALTAIDVDSARHASRGGQDDAILETNLEAASEIAHQIRLRSLGGVLVIDFIRMRESAHRNRVVEALREALRSDSLSSVFGMTRAGLVEVSRRRRRAPLAEILTEPCTVCGAPARLKTPRTVGYDVLRALMREQAARPGGGWHITASAKVTAELLGEMKDNLKELEAVIGASVTLVADDDFPRERFDMAPGNTSGETP